MSEKKEVAAISLKEAIQKAAEELHIEEDKVQYRIITEKTKYFGHKQREIFIEAWSPDGSELDTLSKFVRNLLDAMKLQLEFDLEDNPNFLRVNFSGDDYRLMLYQNGNLLNAVQYLLNRLYSDPIGKKIYCECENYRKKKEIELSSMANNYAKQVRRSGRAIKLPELNPFERRIIHMTINKYADLESKSDGDNFLKVITIKKKDKDNGR
jgi:spoIIIJ-associated protein